MEVAYESSSMTLTACKVCNLLCAFDMRPEGLQLAHLLCTFNTVILLNDHLDEGNGGPRREPGGT
eukprot:scaffold15720_cov22-Tisochrysis_lutea.AAC.1